MNSDITNRTNDHLDTNNKKITKRSLRVIILSVVGAAFFVIALYYLDQWWRYGRFYMTTDDAYVGGNVTPIAAHVSGFVKIIPIGDNDYVRRGQIVLELNANDLRAAEERANARVLQSEAAVTALQARYTAQGAAINAAEAVVAAKQATEKFAAANAVRYQHLADGQATSRQSVQRSAASEASSAAIVRAAKAQLMAARQRRKVLATEITAARAMILAAQADLRMAQIARGYATITAPINGYIADRYAQRGAFVAAGATLLSIVPAHGLWVDANFKENDLARIKPGERATITADELPNHVFHGHVVSLAPATGAVFSVIPPQNATGNFTKTVQRVPVRIALDGRASQLGLLRPGLSTTVSVDTKHGPLKSR